METQQPVGGGPCGLQLPTYSPPFLSASLNSEDCGKPPWEQEMGMSCQKPKMMAHCLSLPPTQEGLMAPSDWGRVGSGQKATHLLQDPLAEGSPAQAKAWSSIGAAEFLSVGFGP